MLYQCLQEVQNNSEDVANDQDHLSFAKQSQVLEHFVQMTEVFVTRIPQ